MAQVLAEVTGARIGRAAASLGGTSASTSPRSSSGAEFDKWGPDRAVPIPEALAEEHRGFKVKFATVGDGWLFQCADKDDHWPREIFGELYDRVEQHARVPTPDCRRHELAVNMSRRMF